MSILNKLKEAILDLEVQLELAELTQENCIYITNEKGYLLLAMAKRVAENIEKQKAKKEQKDE